MTSNRVRFDQVRSMDFAAITASYTALGTVFGHKMRVVHFINDTDADIMVSFDGFNDNTPILADTFSLYDLTSDQDNDERFRYEINTQISIKYLQAPTRGTFYAVCIYGQGE